MSHDAKRASHAPPSIGLTLGPDAGHLQRIAPLFELVDHFEIAPETTWRERGGELLRNDYFDVFGAIAAIRGKPLVAHGVGFSLGSRSDARQARWLEQMERDHRELEFAWWTDHLGPTELAARTVTLPCPLPYDRETADEVRRALALMREVVPLVGVENSAFYVSVDEPALEPAFLHAITEGGASHLLLDLENLVLNARNLDYDPRDWLARIDLSRVIEIHVAGGDDDAEWLPPSSRRFALDSHSHAVRPFLFELLGEVLPRCSSLRAITLERIEGTVETHADVDAMAADLAKLRGLVARTHASPLHDRVTDSLTLPTRSRDGDWSERFAACLSAPHDAPIDLEGLALARSEGIVLTRLLIQKLRFQRLQRGSARLRTWFDDDPAAFAEAFRAYHAAVPSTALFPSEEAAAFEAFVDAR